MTPATRLVAVMNVLVVVNGAAYGNDATCNAIRLAGALARVHPLPPAPPKSWPVPRSWRFQAVWRAAGSACRTCMMVSTELPVATSAGGTSQVDDVNSLADRPRPDGLADDAARLLLAVRSRRLASTGPGSGQWRDRVAVTQARAAGRKAGNLA